MATFILSILGTIGGAILGAFLGFFLIIAIGTAAGDTGFEGALAMGAAATGAPLGAMLGAAIGLSVVVLARTGKTPIFTARGWGIAAAATAGLFVLLGLITLVTRTPEFGSPRPELIVEARIPLDMVDEPHTKRLWPLYVRADTRVGPYEELERWTEGEFAYARLRYVMVYRVKERQLYMPVEYGHFVVFDLPIGKRPEPTDTYTDWQKPVGMAEDRYVDPRTTEGIPDYSLRWMVLWEGK